MKINGFGAIAIVLLFLNLGLAVQNIARGTLEPVPINFLAMGFCTGSIMQNVKLK